MKNVISSQKETDKRIYKFPTSQVKLNGKKSSYYEVIHSLAFAECNNALVNVFKRINMKRIQELIVDTPLVTDIQRLFYIHMIRERYSKIIKASYDSLMEMS